MTALAVLILGLLAQDKALKKLEWKLAPGHAAEFAYLDKAGKPLPDQKLIVFGTELTPNSNRLAVDTYEQIPLAMLFQLPPEPIKAAAGWEYQNFFFNDAYDALGGFEDMLRRVPDLRKVKALIGYKPTLGVEQIVDRVIEFERARLPSP